ncbi:MAG TPA: hypothetical protein PKV41_06030 [Candidatus Omnitrophota bacterium]|nr:hypothetical protein [Candidatus Omnitrophota bacterium]
MVSFWLIKARKIKPRRIQKTQLLFGFLGRFLGDIFRWGRFIFGLLRLLLFVFGFSIAAIFL